MIAQAVTWKIRKVLPDRESTAWPLLPLEGRADGLRWFLDPDSLDAGVTYAITATLDLEFRASSRFVDATINYRGSTDTRFTTAAPPSGGSCSVSPPCGTSLATKFTVKCEDYIAGAPGGELEYQTVLVDAASGYENVLVQYSYSPTSLVDLPPSARVSAAGEAACSGLAWQEILVKIRAANGAITIVRDLRARAAVPTVATQEVPTEELQGAIDSGDADTFMQVALATTTVARQSEDEDAGIALNQGLLESLLSFQAKEEEKEEEEEGGTLENRVLQQTQLAAAISQV